MQLFPVGKVYDFMSQKRLFVTISFLLVLASLPADQVDRPVILASYRKMMRALLRYQGDDGLWRQVIDLDTAGFRDTEGDFIMRAPLPR